MNTLVTEIEVDSDDGLKKDEKIRNFFSNKDDTESENLLTIEERQEVRTIPIIQNIDCFSSKYDPYPLFEEEEVKVEVVEDYKLDNMVR